MIEAERVKERGVRLFGLMPRREQAGDAQVEKREWKTIYAQDLKEGDIWAEKGLVVSVSIRSEAVTITSGVPEPEDRIVGRWFQLKAFVVAEEGGEDGIGL